MGRWMRGGCGAAVRAAAGGGPACGQDDRGFAWTQDEEGVLADQTQLTFPSKFVRAGEAYFDPTGEWIIFQAQEKPGGAEDLGPHYAMYVARLRKDGGRVLGIEEPIRVSPPGSSNTCGWFLPDRPGAVLFGSTIAPPKEQEPTGFQRATGKYKWDFPPEMEVVRNFVPDIAVALAEAAGVDEESLAVMRAIPISEPPRVWSRWGYDAECSYSPDGRFILHTQVDPKTGEADIWVFDEDDSSQTALITEKGYDGGASFSPDGWWICYRSVRTGDGLLQVYIGEVQYGAGGMVRAMVRELPVTANGHVNWAPFWHPSGEYLLYTTSELGHENYEVFAVEAPRGPAFERPVAELRKRRVTNAGGFDGLPSLSADGKFMMWTSQRGPRTEDGTKNSQVWIARVVGVDPRVPVVKGK